MLSNRHSQSVKNILKMFSDVGYDVSLNLANASDYGVAQDRKRVFYIGFRKDLNSKFNFPAPLENKLTLKDVLWELRDSALPAAEKNKHNPECINNHEYMTGGFSTIFMSRNRVRSWDEQSFTIQAGGRHAPIHPDAPKMILVGQDKRVFEPGKEYLYRRLSVRECAKIQSFPDDFIFYYLSIADGYKMVGNAVPVQLAYYVAKAIINTLI